MDGSCYRLLVSGPSGSGKTSLASLLSASLRCAGWDVREVHQDDYFATGKAPSYWGQENKDTPAAINMAAFLEAIERAAQGVKVGWGQSPTLLLVEGFLLLQEPAIVGRADAVIFLSAPGDVCLSRRLNRSHRSAHENEGCRVYWHECVWPSFLSITRPALLKLLATAAPTEAHDGGAECWPPLPALYHSSSPTLVLDGETPLGEVLQRALAALPELLALNAPYDWMGPVAGDAVEVAARHQPSPLHEPLLLLCRVLRHACIESDVRAALLSHGALPLLQRLQGTVVDAASDADEDLGALVHALQEAQQSDDRPGPGVS